MKKFSLKGKLLIGVLTLCLCSAVAVGVVSFTPPIQRVSAGATPVAQVGNFTYTNYKEAWDAAQKTGSITMLADWETTHKLTVNESNSITLYMGGHMINHGLGAKSVTQIFLVKKNASLRIIGEEGNTTPHRGNTVNNVWMPSAEGDHYFYGALLTGGRSADGGGAIHIQNNGSVEIKNVTIAGNMTTDHSGAGAIRLQGSNAYLKVENSEICYNWSLGAGGGAIRIEGKDSNVKLINTKVHHNTASNLNSDGGAIQINHGSVYLSNNTEIACNSAYRNGGGIYISNGNLSMDSSVVLSRNHAGNEGGAIYVNADADRVTISGTISANTSKKPGGAVYVNSSINGDKGVTIKNAEIIGNISDSNAGGVCVDSDNNIALDQTVVIIGNTPNNLYLRSENNIKSNSLTDGSEIGLYTTWTTSSSKPVKTSNYKYFKSDTIGYAITGDDTKLYRVKETKEVPDVYAVNGHDYLLEKGQFVYNSIASGNMTAYYYYSDGFFAKSAKYYDTHLATFAANLAITAPTSPISGGYTEEKAAKNIVDFFKSLGFDRIMLHYPEPEYFGPDSEILSTIGYIIGQKTIHVNGKNVTLLATVVRGGGYGAEWASNVTLGPGCGEAKGFSDAATQVKSGIDQYISDYSLDTTNTKFLVTGFSRAAATSNLVSKRLTDTYGEDNVYGYCFETPMGGVYSAQKAGYSYANIHNIINAVDIVPMVGTTQMGFIRYGVDHIVPANTVGSDNYKAQKKVMLKHLAAISPSLQFNDRFCSATIEYFFNYIGTSDLISEHHFRKIKAQEWLPYFIERLQSYALTSSKGGAVYDKNSAYWKGYRNYWSTYNWKLYESGSKILNYDSKNPPKTAVTYKNMTIESAVADLMNLYFGASSEKKSQLAAAIDPDKIMKNLSLGSIYFKVIGKWDGFSIAKKNEWFNKIWGQTQLEQSFTGILTTEEISTFKHSFYVVFDMLMTFVSVDYNLTDQDVLGTLLNNISNILQTHYTEVVCAWVRSYDTFYVYDDSYKSPPLAPTSSLQNGVYEEDVTVELTADNKNATIYYTIDGSDPVIGEPNTYTYQKPFTLSVVSEKRMNYIVKAVCVFDGMTSEVSTYNYILNTNPEINVIGDYLSVNNLNVSAYLIVASYDDMGAMTDYVTMKVNNNEYFLISELGLDTSMRLTAYLVRDLYDLQPLCSEKEINYYQEEPDYFDYSKQNRFNLTSFNVKTQDNPEYIDINFAITDTTVDRMTIAIYEQNNPSEFLYFRELPCIANTNYTITFKRELLANVLNSSSVNGASLIFKAGGNGVYITTMLGFKYDENAYIIDYVLNGGVNSSNNPSVYSENSGDITFESPERTHYTFDGWYDNEQFTGDAVTTIASGSTGNITLYAKWVVNNYTITYTDGVDDEEIFADQVYVAPYGSDTPAFVGTPKRTGHIFCGWDDEFSMTVVGDAVYTAIWVVGHEHDPVFVEGLDSTCAHYGYKHYYYCDGCGYFEDVDCTIAILDLNDWIVGDGRIDLKEHNFVAQIQDEEYLVIGTGLNCQDVFEFYYACDCCGAVGEQIWVSDVYGEHDFDGDFTHCNGQHYHVCTNEGCTQTTEKVDCYGGHATCTQLAVCDGCGHTYGELLEHSYDQIKHDASKHWHECVCGVKEPKGAEPHYDKDRDGVCDACGYTIDYTVIGCKSSFYNSQFGLGGLLILSAGVFVTAIVRKRQNS